MPQCHVKTISLAEHLEEWVALYDVFVRRHGLYGVHAFSSSYFERHSEMANLVTVGAFVDGILVSCHLWIDSGPSAYSHLAASNETGYACGAAYAFSILSACEVIDLGGAADRANTTPDGLSRFKRGFANRECHSWLCGKVLMKDVYESLCAEVNPEAAEGGYFPAYRASDR